LLVAIAWDGGSSLSRAGDLCGMCEVLSEAGLVTGLVFLNHGWTRMTRIAWNDGEGEVPSEPIQICGLAGAAPTRILFAAFEF